MDERSLLPIKAERPSYKGARPPYKSKSALLTKGIALPTSGERPRPPLKRGPSSSQADERPPHTGGRPPYEWRTSTLPGDPRTCKRRSVFLTRGTVLLITGGPSSQRGAPSLKNEERPLNKGDVRPYKGAILLTRGPSSCKREQALYKRRSALLTHRGIVILITGSVLLKGDRPPYKRGKRPYKRRNVLLTWGALLAIKAEVSPCSGDRPPFALFAALHCNRPEAWFDR